MEKPSRLKKSECHQPRTWSRSTETSSQAESRLLSIRYTEMTFATAFERADHRQSCRVIFKWWHTARAALREGNRASTASHKLQEVIWSSDLAWQWLEEVTMSPVAERHCVATISFYFSACGRWLLLSALQLLGVHRLSPAVKVLTWQSLTFDLDPADWSPATFSQHCRTWSSSYCAVDLLGRSMRICFVLTFRDLKKSLFFVMLFCSNFCLKSISLHQLQP